MPVGTRIRANNVFGKITNNPLAAGATTLNAPELALLPEVVVGNHAVLTLDPLRTNGEPEIVIVTAHSPGSSSATIDRGAYGTLDRQHPLNTVFVHAPLDEDVITITDSTSRPVNPYAGQVIFQTDTDSYVRRNAANTIWEDLVPAELQLGSANPTTINIGTSASPGVSVDASHEDHTHAVGTPGIPTSATAGQAGATGASTVPSRSDHQHATPSLPATATISTNQTRNNSVYGDLATVGPTVTVTTGTRALVGIKCQMGAAAGIQGAVSFQVTGATAVSPDDSRGIILIETDGTRSATFLVSLNAGSNTFTLKYRTVGGSAGFSRRDIWVLPVN